MPPRSDPRQSTSRFGPIPGHGPACGVDACADCWQGPDPICGRLLIGQGSDTYDPLCVRPPGHDGLCKPREDLMSELNLHESMIDRAAKALAGTDADYRYVSEADTREAAAKVLRAAFEGVPLNNYAIGTLLHDFDLVIVVKEHPHSAAALVARRETDRGPEDGFDTAGHTLTVNWGNEPARYIKSVTVGKIDAPYEGS